MIKFSTERVNAILLYISITLLSCRASFSSEGAVVLYFLSAFFLSLGYIYCYRLYARSGETSERCIFARTIYAAREAREVG